jgi:hypothetical protein
MACRDDRLALQPIAPKQDRRRFRVVVIGGHRQVRQPQFHPIHAERGLGVWWSRPGPVRYQRHCEPTDRAHARVR